MGGIDYNIFLDNMTEPDHAAYMFLDKLTESDDHTEPYLLFLRESLEGKRPGLGDLILTPEQPSKEVVDTFRTPVLAHQDYTVVYIDATAFEGGGTLTANIQVGRDNGIGIFHLLNGDKNSRQKKYLMALIPQNGTAKKAMNIRRHLAHLPESGGYSPVNLDKLRISSIVVNALNYV